MRGVEVVVGLTHTYMADSYVEREVIDMKVNAKQQEEKQVIKEAKGLQKKHDLQRKLDRELKSCL